MAPPLLGLLVSFLAMGAVSAAPAWTKELTSAAKGPHPDLRSTTLDFQLTWKGMLNSGSLRMEFAPPDVKKVAGTMVVRTAARSHGAAGKLYPYQSHFWSELRAKSLHPRYFEATETNSKDHTTTAVRYFKNRVESTETTRVHRTRATTVDSDIFPFAPVFDIASAMLHIRSQPLNRGDKIGLLIHPFHTPYLLRVHCHGREIHNGRHAIRLTFGMQKIDRKTHELRVYKKLKRDVTLWISDDADRIPIEFRAAVFIGDVRATLVRQL